jgi:hypothetical protein
MSEKDTNNESVNEPKSVDETEQGANVENLIEEFKVYAIRSISSAEMLKRENLHFAENDKEIFSEKAELSEKEIDSLLEKSPIFKQLSEPKLPALPRENRARLQMQSPTRLYFYWSIKNDPFQTLNRIFGASARNYTLVAKLINHTQNREEIVPIDTAGSWWFDVDANSNYRIEIGFYATNRPFVSLMFSNSVQTPRKNPSPHRDFSMDWAISANEFAQVLDVSGFAQDAIEVALAGDDSEFAETATRNAFAQVFSNGKTDFTADDSSEIRFVLLALASGYAAENLRGQISKSLFAKLLENLEILSAEKALTALQENFGEYTDQTIEEGFGQTIFGASSINFPKFSKRRVFPKFSPISSFRF